MMRRYIPLLMVLGLLVSLGSAFAQNPGRNWGSTWPGGLNEGRTNPDIGYLVATSWGLRPAILMDNFNMPSYSPHFPELANTTIPKFVNDGTDDLADFSSSFFNAVGKGSPKAFRTAPPLLIQDGAEIKREAWTVFDTRFDGLPADQFEAVIPGLGSDVYHEAQRVHTGGIHERIQSWRWANAEAQDIIFQIQTYTYPENPRVPDVRTGERGTDLSPETRDKNPMLQNFYLGTHWFMQAANRGPSGGSHITPTFGNGSRPFEAGIEHGILDEVNNWDDELKLMYSYDGNASDRTGTRPDGDDRGEPAPAAGVPKLDEIREALVDAGEFLESEYKGRVFLHVDKTPVSDPNTLSDNWLDDMNEPDLEMRQPRVARWVPDASWITTESADMAAVHDFYTQPNTTRVERIRNVATSVESQQGYWEWMVTFGPWPELNPGESIHVVSAWIVTGPSSEENKRVGRMWSEGSISFAEKEAFLNSGLDSLKAAVAVAHKAWNNREVNSVVGLQPVLPPTPDWPSRIEITSGPDQNELSWAAVPGAASYRVYRMAGFETKPPGLRDVFTVNGTSYNDDTVIRGTRYYYAVTAVDANGLESSYFATRTLGDGVSPFRAPGRDIASVRIVPNPFQIQGGDLEQGGFNFTGQANKLLFVNLPASAIIRIFSITGDLIQEFEHTAGSGDLSWDLMINDNNQFLVSGIYFAHIESRDPQVPGTHIEKFIVVR